MASNSSTYSLQGCLVIFEEKGRKQFKLYVCFFIVLSGDELIEIILKNLNPQLILLVFNTAKT